MSQRNFPSVLDAYLKLVNESEAPHAFRRWTGISLIASCLQRKCWLSWETEIYPNLYVVLVGPSGSRKGTAMGPARRILQDLGIPLTAESTTREALIEHMREVSLQFIDPRFPEVPTYHNSLTIFSPELAVFLGVDNKEFLSALTDWFDCPDPWSYRTRKMGTEQITQVWVNLIGATTPELIKTTLPQDAIGGGLTSRIIFIYAKHPEKPVPFPVNPFTNEALYEALKADLTHIQALSGEFVVHKSFKEAYKPWYMDSFKNPPFIDVPNLEPYLTRRSLHIRKLAMIMSASRSSEMVVKVEDFDSALAVLSDAENSMASVFISYGRLDTTVIFQRVMAVIRRKKSMWYSELVGMFINDLTPEELKNIVGVLYDQEFCTLDKELRGDTKKTKVRFNALYRPPESGV